MKQYLHVTGRSCVQHPNGEWIYWDESRTSVVRCDESHEPRPPIAPVTDEAIHAWMDGAS